ncbi:MAG: DUF2726 domain-containing protein [Pseudomonadota bacterium]
MKRPILSRLFRKPELPLPDYQRKHFFDVEEKVFYGRLRRALPKCYIFPDVELGALIAPTSQVPREQRAKLAQLHGRKVDFAVFDARLALLCVIELVASGADEAESNTPFLKAAAIPRFCWDEAQLPSSEQILRTLAEFSTLPPPKFDASGRSTQAEQARNLDAVQAVYQTAPSRSMLTVDVLDELAPEGKTKDQFPHVWQRICLFCNEPRHLAQYLGSLSLQDRGGKRAGFPPDVLAEIAAIQSANQCFAAMAPKQRSSWNTAFINR